MEPLNHLTHHTPNGNTATSSRSDAARSTFSERGLSAAITQPPAQGQLLAAVNAATIEQSAFLYHDAGFTVIPKLKGAKVPGISGWQNLRPTKDDLHLWYSTGKYDGVAMRPGALSNNVCVIDTDDLLSYGACLLYTSDAADE